MKSCRESPVDLGLEGRLRVQRILTVVTVLACVLLGGCGEDPTLWSATLLSPDGNWIAVAHTVLHSGPGANGAETIVEIKQTKVRIFDRMFRKTSTRVLAFANDGASMGLKMNWATPSHLDVVFRDDPEMLYYHVARTSGVEISVRDLADPSSFSPAKIVH
jgi:hypothetical protein